MKRRKHHGKEQTQNTCLYVIRIARRTGARTSAEFSTMDRRKAYREARKFAAAGRLLSFARHSGRGTWQDLTPSVTDVGGEAS
ncbi:hypothetical protein [Streptomyces spinosisporus]|uniref:Uncharacterized protein n=1 Tax=Streptomyces spinosisporus TaxID=2927582 RepID=A0ABS9XDW9_9ACTN|nr:hypothetical protein [Streptomyces spinosisporus]MCI3240241.1 hypothetical protein [Streptomyces spinosisporus]